jgi:hypothetical protein
VDVLQIKRSKISGAKISEAKISKAKISEAKISGAKISEAKISEAKISEAKISKAKISEAKISEANNFIKVDLHIAVKSLLILPLFLNVTDHPLVLDLPIVLNLVNLKLSKL